jgi:hypothetical protein
MKADKTQSAVDRNPPVSGWNLKHIQNVSFEIVHALTDLLSRTRWRSWLRHCATSRKVAGPIPHGVTGIFIDIILPAAYGPGVDRNGYLEGKGGQCVRLTLPPCLKIWGPQPPGTLWACNRPDLHIENSFKLYYLSVFARLAVYKTACLIWSSNLCTNTPVITLDRYEQ